MTNSELKFLLLLIVFGGIAAGIWFYREPPVEPPAVAVAEPTVTEPETPAPDEPVEPKYPVEPAGALVPLPALDDSDSYFLLALVDVMGEPIENLVNNEALIDRFVTTIDNLPSQNVAERVRPIGRLTTAFAAEPLAGSDRYRVSPDNAARYDLPVQLMLAADTELILSTYRRFYPLFQQSYERLGYPNAWFNDRLIEVLDHLLEAPRLEAPAELVRPHVLYEFADEGLQDLSSGQKLMLRIGAQHAADVKAKLREIREGLTQ